MLCASWLSWDGFESFLKKAALSTKSLRNVEKRARQPQPGRGVLASRPSGLATLRLFSLLVVS